MRTCGHKEERKGSGRSAEYLRSSVLPGVDYRRLVSVVIGGAAEINELHLRVDRDFDLNSLAFRPAVHRLLAEITRPQKHVLELEVRVNQVDGP